MSEKIDLAVKLFKEKKYKECIDAFSSVLETEPDNADVYNNMAVAYCNVGDIEQAEKFFLKSIELDPQLVQPYISLSDLYYKKGDIAHAIGTLERGSYENTDNILLCHLLARVYIEDQRWDMAIDELEKVLATQPDNYDAHYDMGRVYFEMGDYESAIAYFENVIEYKENNEFLYYYLAQAYEGNNEIDKAISNYLKAIAVNDKFHPAYKKVGIMFLARNDYKDALEYFSDYVNFDIPQEEKDSVGKLIERIKTRA